jgi:glycosyltransferase involved in cell wall biosynthesis
MGDKGTVFMIAAGSIKNGVPEAVSFVKSQAESLRQAGWKVILSIVDDRTSVRGITRNLRRIREEVARSKPGLIHAQYGSVTAALAYCVKGSMPLVISFCGDDLLGTPNPGFLSRIRERCARAIGLLAARGATTIIVKSTNLLNALPVRLRRKATVLPNGVDVSRFRPMDKLHARAKLGWPTGERVVLFNASSHTETIRKNISLARKSVDVISRTVPDVTLREICNASPDEVQWMLNAADCLLVTSLHEGSPNIVKEAMACNLPVVSVPCGDVSERLAGALPGGVCTYDAVTLADAIKEVFKAGCRSNGLEQLMAQGLSATAVAERLSKLYCSAQQGDSEIPELYKSACAE